MSTPKDPFSIFFDCFFKKPEEPSKQPENKKRDNKTGLLQTFVSDITQDIIITLYVFGLVFAVMFLFFVYSLIFG